MPTAVAPKASALKISVPRRMPPSMNTGMRPPTAATISGRHSMVERRVSSPRPPWFDTTMPSAPACMASTASSGDTMPFTMNLTDTNLRKRCR